MSDTPFQPQLRNIRDIFRTTLLSIPRYQRPYSWSPENIQEFFNDVVDAPVENYFVGPMVVFREGPRFAVVDGQQRLTTITLLLSEIRELLLEIGEQTLAIGVHGFIETADEDNEMHFVLNSQAAGGLLYENHLKHPRVNLVPPRNEDQRNIEAASRDLRTQLRRHVGLEADPVDGGDDEPIGQVGIAKERVLALRNKILGLTVIWVPLDSEEQAYQIFETLNSRGKDLDTVDLLKNLVLSGLPAENADHDSRAEEWRELRRILDEDGKGVRPANFVLHWWLSRAPYVAEKRVFGAVRKAVKSSEIRHSALLTELIQNSRLYVKIANPAGVAWPKEHRAVRDSLEALQIFGVRQPRPLLLAALRSFDEGRMNLGQLKRLLASVESFHFITTAVMRLTSSGGTSKMYASYALKLTAAQDKNRSAEVIAEIVKSLGSRVPGDGFEAAFVERLRYSRSEPDQKDLVGYVLRRVQHHFRPKAPLSPIECNVEHLEPQATRLDWVAEIGNLLWVTEAINDELGDKPFAAKQAILAKHASVLPVDDILTQATWGPDEVRARSVSLASLALTDLWRMSNGKAEEPTST